MRAVHTSMCMTSTSDECQRFGVESEVIAQMAQEKSITMSTGTRPRLILMMIGRGGGGHKATACAVEAALRRSFSEGALEIRMVDTGYLVESFSTGREMRTKGFDFDEFYNLLMQYNFFRLAGAIGYLSGLMFAVLGGSIKRGLEKFFAAEQPDLVMSFVPFFNACFRDSLSASCSNAPLLTCITDFTSTSAHCWIDAWAFEASAQHYIIAGGQLLQQQAAALGYPKEHIIATPGMVVHPSFHDDEEQQKQPKQQLVAQLTALIFFGGCAPMRVESIVQGLRSSHPGIEVVVICGKNEVLRKRLAARGDCLVEGYIPPSRVLSLMRRASFILGKPGPGVVSEACATGTPYVTEDRNVMPQERSVLDWITDSGAGFVVGSLAKLPDDLLGRVEKCRMAIATLRAVQPAVWTVAEAVHRLLLQGRLALDEDKPRK